MVVALVVAVPLTSEETAVDEWAATPEVEGPGLGDPATGAAAVGGTALGGVVWAEGAAVGGVGWCGRRAPHWAR